MFPEINEMKYIYELEREVDGIIILFQENRNMSVNEFEINLKKLLPDAKRVIEKGPQQGLRYVNLFSERYDWTIPLFSYFEFIGSN